MYHRQQCKPKPIRIFCFLLLNPHREKEGDTIPLNPHVEKEGDTIPLREEKPGEEKKSETLGTTAM